MILIKTTFLSSLFCLIIGLVQAQADMFTLGKVTAADLELKTYPADPEAEAVVLQHLGVIAQWR